MSKTQILLVDDYVLWHQHVPLLLQSNPQLQVICAITDGFEAIEKAQALQPDLILLDIGLPGINGLEAARRIREISPSSKIVFLTDNRDQSIMDEALKIGHGYVIKSEAGRKLLPAIETVLPAEVLALELRAQA